ncbi:YdeI/OmpD-associated family protein [Sphingobacterium allocomposti]|nr:YdeI/OmpD-associated family protein [Sphingobacterium composti Yoo et al. 2007 non Ten et al. 2007]
MYEFEASLDIIGINPFVFVPEHILDTIFQDAGRDKGPIPIKGYVNENPYTQTLVRFKGSWRLYINMKMLPASPKRIGEIITVSIGYNPTESILDIPADLMEALSENSKANAIFLELPPYLKKEIIRYISALKTPASRAENIRRAIGFLLGENRFIGRNPL